MIVSVNKTPLFNQLYCF